MWNQNPSFRFEIDNFSEKETAISSHEFVSGGYEWFLCVHPKGDSSLADDHLSLFLYAANPKPHRTGWKRTANFYFLLLNQSDKELYKSPILGVSNIFCAKSTGFGYLKTLPVSKFQEKGFLAKDRLIIEVYINNVEAVDGEVGDVSDNKIKTVDINGFQVLASQVTLARKVFADHPDFAQDIKPKNQVVKTEYMNVLLGIINTLNKPPCSLSKTELSNARSELTELTEEGFKLDWLKSKLKVVSLDRKKADADGSRVDELEERIKNLEQTVSDLKAELNKERSAKSSTSKLSKLFFH